MEVRLRKAVWDRAGAMCEYCRMPQGFDPVTFELEHIIPEKHDGATELDSLALACFFCNRFKGPNLAGVDPETQQIVPLFHPRHQSWAEHFFWSNGVLKGRSPEARATIAVLRKNDPARVTLRTILTESGDCSF